MAPKPEKTGKKLEVPRDAKGRIPKGISGNPKGRPKGAKTKFTLENLKSLDDAVKNFHWDKGESFWEGALRLSVKLAKKGNSLLMCKLIDKLLASKTSAELNNSDESPFIVKIEKD